MKLNEKIRIALENNEWTQKYFSELMSVAPTTVQKWIVGKNTPSVETTIQISKLLNIPIQDLLDDSVVIHPYYETGVFTWPFSLLHEDGAHTVIDAGLKGNAYLHRFYNKAGCAYSAIYCGKYEIWSQIRERERFMINAWNEWGYKTFV